MTRNQGGTVAKRALICGVSGQDGAYLAQHLLDLGYEVFGTSRDVDSTSFQNLERLRVRDRVRLHSMSPIDFRSVLQCLAKVGPTEIYNLAGQTSVGLSFEQPVEAFESISVGTLNLLEAIRFQCPKARFYNAGSGEIFGDTGREPVDEQSRIAPGSPYAVAKATAMWTTTNYREAYGLFACSGILFNHESPLRSFRFVTRKIIRQAIAIHKGDPGKLRLANMDIVRDWGWAPEYVVAMHAMLQIDRAQEFIVATGRSYSLEQFVEAAFGALGLDYREHVELDEASRRPLDHQVARASPAKAERLLGWKARYAMPEVVRLMIEAELKAAG
jgi:GDPmannose 4,6-dehydratase